MARNSKLAKVMIKSKKGICIDCPPLSSKKYLIAKRCEFHYWPYRNSLKQKCDSNKIVFKTPLINRSKPNKPSKKSVCLPFASRFACKQWYILQISLCNWVCENCGIRIIPVSELVQFSVQAHILPKNKFPSVKMHLDNHLTLGVSDCSCHKKWDLSWESAKKMHVFPVARSKIVKLLPHLTQKELSILPDIFRDLIEIK